MSHVGIVSRLVRANLAVALVLGGSVVMSRNDTLPADRELLETSAGSTMSTGGAVACIGDGTSGPRVQAVYARAADVADRTADVVPLIRQWAGGVDQVFLDSAAETGGVRRVRWVTDGSCKLDVLSVQLSRTGDDSMSNTTAELRSRGLNRTDRKYLVWMDGAVYCGVASNVADDTPGATNANNRGPTFARVDAACWGKALSVEAHELMHTLGAVQASAPHASGGGHCNEEYDRMCYQQRSGETMVYACGSSHERLFDCGHDDYFHTSPPAGSYLATHWNTADSVFLDGGQSSDPSPEPEPSPEPGAVTTITDTWSGSLSKRTTARSHEFEAGAGEIAVEVAVGRSAVVAVRILAADGTVLASKSGTSGTTLSVTANAGRHVVEVSSSAGNVSYTATVTRAAP